jgi:hypothetical protein
MIVRLDLDELEAELGEEVQGFIVELANEIVNQMKVEAPVGATGDLQRSIQIFRTGDGVVWLGTRIHYAMDVWKGTDPHLADFDKIEVWARRKLGSEAAAGPVWRKIAREGTEPNDFVGRAIDEAVNRVTI